MCFSLKWASGLIIMVHPYCMLNMLVSSCSRFLIIWTIPTGPVKVLLYFHRVKLQNKRQTCRSWWLQWLIGSYHHINIELYSHALRNDCCLNGILESSFMHRRIKHNKSTWCNSPESLWQPAERRCQTVWSQLECQGHLLDERTAQV